MYPITVNSDLCITSYLEVAVAFPAINRCGFVCVFLLNVVASLRSYCMGASWDRGRDMFAVDVWMPKEFEAGLFGKPTIEHHGFMKTTDDLHGHGSVMQYI